MLQFGTPGTNWNSNLVLTEGTWNHVAVTWTAGGNMTMYVNGIGASIGNVAACSSSVAFSIIVGKMEQSDYWGLNGKIDNFQIYNTILSASDIQAMLATRTTPQAFTWNGGTGNWDTNTNWSPWSNVLPGGVIGDTVKLAGGDGTITLNGTRTVARLVSAGNNYTLVGPGAVTLNGNNVNLLVTSAYVPGDVDHIGGLNSKDIDAIFVHFGDPYTSQYYKVAPGTDPVGQVDVTYELEHYFSTTYGDANLDGVVDGLDFQCFLNNFFNAPGIFGWADGSFHGNLDTQVDGLDFQYLVNNWGYGTSGGSIGSIPEPATMTLLALGGLALLRRRNRK